jgi:hypothetical protein
MRRNPALATQLRARVLQLQGVRAADVNTVTGSLLVLYDRVVLPLPTLWSELRSLGCVSQDTAATSPVTEPLSEWALVASRTIGGALVAELIDVSALALVRALI